MTLIANSLPVQLAAAIVDAAETHSENAGDYAHVSGDAQDVISVLLGLLSAEQLRSFAQRFVTPDEGSVFDVLTMDSAELRQLVEEITSTRGDAGTELTRTQLAELLRDAASRVADGDSAEGSVTYTSTAGGPLPSRFQVTAFLSTGAGSGAPGCITC